MSAAVTTSKPSTTESCTPKATRRSSTALEETTNKAGGSGKPSHSWLGSLAVAAHGTRERSVPAEDLVGLSEMFATPPVATGKKPRAKAQPSRWLASLGRATAAPKTRTAVIEDLGGVSEMFATPPVKDQGKDMGTPVEVITAVAPSYTPSLRAAQLNIHAIEAIAPSTTPSLRSACQARHSSFPDSPVVHSFHLELPESPLELVDAVQPSTTPSLRSASKAKTKGRKSVPRKSVEYTGISRLLRTPKALSNPADPADNYVPEMFQSPTREQRTQPTRKSLALEGVARLLRTPKAPKETHSAEEYFQSEMFASPHVSPTPHKEEDVEGARARRTAVSKATADKKKGNKRAVPADASFTEAQPKRTRSTRAANTEQELQTTAPPVRNTRSRSKSRLPEKQTPAMGVMQTPTPLVFQRSALEPITEVETPLESLCNKRTAVQDSPMLALIKEQDANKPTVNQRNAKVPTARPRRSTRKTQEPEQPVNPTPPGDEQAVEKEKPKKTRSTRASRRAVDESATCDADEPGVLIARTRTRSRALQEPQAKPRSRNSRTKKEVEDSSGGEADSGRRTRATSKTVCVPDEVAKPKRATRRRQTKKEECAESSTKKDEPETATSEEEEEVTKIRETRSARAANRKTNAEAEVERSTRSEKADKAQPGRVTRGQKRAATESAESKPPAAKKTRAVQRKAITEAVLETRQTRQSVRCSTRSRK